MTFDLTIASGRGRLEKGTLQLVANLGSGNYAGILDAKKFAEEHSEVILKLAALTGKIQDIPYLEKILSDMETGLKIDMKQLPDVDKSYDLGYINALKFVLKKGEYI